MATAKEVFIERFATLENVLSSAEVTPLSLTQRAHNEKARMLRNGLAIIEFNIIEDFIKRRIGEAFKFIGNCGISFNSLPDNIIEASVFHALKGIMVRAENLKRTSEDYVSFIQSETKFISSTLDSNFELSEYTLGWDKSNLSTEDLKVFFKIFNINGGWNSIKEVSSLLNITIVQPSDIFRNAAQRRHNAAHNPNADSPLNDLTDFILQAKIIALGCDALISKSLKYIKDNNNDFLQGNLKVTPSDLKFRFLKYVDGKWKEYVGNNTRAYRVNTDFNTILTVSKSRASANSEILVIKPSDNCIKNWIITEI